jgi:hypothetical protein
MNTSGNIQGEINLPSKQQVFDLPMWFLIKLQPNGCWQYTDNEGNKPAEIYLRGVVRDSNGVMLEKIALIEDLRRHGQGVMKHWQGDYFIAVNDSKRKESWCACGPLGCESAYVVQKEKKVIVGSDPLQIARYTNRRIDETGLFMFLNSGYMWDERTLIKGMRFLPPATICLADGRFKEGPDLEKDDSVKGFENCEEFLQELDQELGRMANEHGRLLVQLSGGVDSRLIAVRCRHLGIPFETVTQGAEVYKDDDFDIAVRVAKSLGVHHHKWHWDATGFLQNADRLILESGGVNDAYTSYPDGIAELSKLAERFSGIVRGDETFGWGITATSATHAAEQLNIDLENRLDGCLIHPQAEVPGLLGQVTDWRDDFSPDESDVWKNAFYRQVRLPRLILPVARWQKLAGTVEFPFTKRQALSTRGFIYSKLERGKGHSISQSTYLAVWRALIKHQRI